MRGELIEEDSVFLLLFRILLDNISRSDENLNIIRNNHLRR